MQFHPPESCALCKIEIRSFDKSKEFEFNGKKFWLCDFCYGCAEKAGGLERLIAIKRKIKGEDVVPGRSYVYTAYADDTSGNGFLTSYSSEKKFGAYLNSEISNLNLAPHHFDGLWVRIKP